jgi:hypothetical protein
VEDWFQEQEELATAASLLTGESADPFGLSLFGLLGVSEKESATTAELNALSEAKYDQAVVDIALASLQVDGNTAMDASIDRSGIVPNEDNTLAVSSSTLLQQKKPFSGSL